MTCKLSQIIEDMLINNRETDDFTVVVNGVQYDVHAKWMRGFMGRKTKQLGIYVIKSEHQG